jgi:hypothetical protein
VDCGRWEPEQNPNHTSGDVQLFSGCEDSQCSVDVGGPGGKLPGGAMTTAFVDVVERGLCTSYPQLMAALHTSMRENHFPQHPLLSSSQVRAAYERERERERERELSWWTHTGGGNALAFKQPT